MCARLQVKVYRVCVYDMCVCEEGRSTWRMSAYRSHCSVCCARCLVTLWPPSKLVACNNFENLLMTAAVPQAKGYLRKRDAAGGGGCVPTQSLKLCNVCCRSFALAASFGCCCCCCCFFVAVVASFVADVVAFKCDSYEHVRFS